MRPATAHDTGGKLWGLKNEFKTQTSSTKAPEEVIKVTTVITSKVERETLSAKHYKRIEDRKITLDDQVLRLPFLNSHRKIRPSIKFTREARVTEKQKTADLELECSLIEEDVYQIFKMNREHRAHMLLTSPTDRKFEKMHLGVKENQKSF